MANPLKKLAGQTAIYGLSSIIGRVFNYLLTPLYTYKFATSDYGVVTEMYAYVAFLVVILTYGMETAFFRFSSKAESIDEKKKIYNTAMLPLLSTSTLFILVSILFAPEIAAWLLYPGHSDYVIWFAIIVGLDALSALPLAKLREENRAGKFAFVNLTFIGVNIGLNLFFIAYCKTIYDNGETNFLVNTFYNPNIGVGYIFIVNLISSIVRVLLLLPEFLKARLKLDKPALKQMLIYAWPLLFAGLAGIINETIDRIMLKRMLYGTLGEKETMSQLGIYGACYKVSILITLFIQAFRYAAEPFFFSKEKDKNATGIYADVMKYFIIVCCFIFLGIMLYIDVAMFFVGEEYRIGVTVVPILLAANVCLGIYYNQSVWYKLTNKTIYGAYIALFGAAITLVLNYLWIPTLGYMGSAWATLICYASMMVVSYFMGQKHYPIRYQLGRISMYLLVTAVVYYLSTLPNYPSVGLKYVVNGLIIVGFAAMVYVLERPKKVVT